MMEEPVILARSLLRPFLRASWKITGRLGSTVVYQAKNVRRLYP